MTRLSQTTGSLGWNYRMPLNGFHIQEKVFPQPAFGDLSLPLSGATFDTRQDDASVTLTLTEAQRVKAVTMSGGGGGDGQTLTLDSFSGFAVHLAILVAPDSLKVSVKVIILYTSSDCCGFGLQLGHLDIYI